MLSALSRRGFSHGADALRGDSSVDNELDRRLLFLHLYGGYWNRNLLNGLAANQTEHQINPSEYSGR